MTSNLIGKKHAARAAGGISRSPFKLCLGGLVLLHLFAAGSILAHDTWVAPSAYFTEPGKPVIFELTSGMKFPALETGPKTERIAKAGFRSAAEKGDLKDLKGGKEALRGTASFSQPGIVTVWFEAKPKELELTDDEVSEYLEEIHAPDSVRAVWDKRQKGAKWKESYIKCAKTVVVVGDGADDKTFAEPVGMSLEMVPLTNPAKLQPGEELTLKLLRDGQPLPQASVALVREGHADRIFQVTDAEGRVSFTPGQAGQYMLTSVILEPTDDSSIWKSRFATLTIQIKERSP